MEDVVADRGDDAGDVFVEALEADGTGRELGGARGRGAVFWRRRQGGGRTRHCLAPRRRRRFASPLASLSVFSVGLIDLDVPDGDDPTQNPGLERREGPGVEVAARVPGGSRAVEAQKREPWHRREELGR